MRIVHEDVTRLNRSKTRTVSSISNFKIIYTHILYAAPAVKPAGFISPLPFVAGVPFVDARSASRMSFGVNIFGATWGLVSSSI